MDLDWDLDWKLDWDLDWDLDLDLCLTSSGKIRGAENYRLLDPGQLHLLREQKLDVPSPTESGM